MEHTFLGNTIISTGRHTYVSINLAPSDEIINQTVV